MSTRPPQTQIRPTRHEERPSEMERRPDGSLRFRPRCSCGWVGEPVDQSRVVTQWDAHVTIANGSA